MPDSMGSLPSCLQTECQKGRQLKWPLSACAQEMTSDGMISVQKGKLEAMPVGEAYDKLAGKWERYFERADEEDAAEGGAAPAAKSGRASALFQRLCMRPSFPGFARSSGQKVGWREHPLSPL